MDYIGSRSLANYFGWCPLPSETYDYIITSFWQWIESCFHQYRPDDILRFQAHTRLMYGTRIIDRVEKWRSTLSVKDQTQLFRCRLKINGVTVIGWDELRHMIELKAVVLAKSAEIRHIHGDLHCANILYNPEQHIFHLVDPRGAWGAEQSIWGDIRYDAAKFLHSFHGSYEYIKNRLSRFQELPNGDYVLEHPSTMLNHTNWLEPLCQRWQVERIDVLWIEALCLLSISRFYQDLALQKQFFLQGLLLLNSLL